MGLRTHLNGLNIIPPVLVISAFGIYMPGTPLRTDHLAVYGALLVCGLIAIRDSQFRFPRVLLPVVLLLVLFLLYCLVVTGVRQEVTISKYVIGQIERWVQPLAVVSIMAMLTQRHPPADLRRAAVLCSKLILWCNALAATFALALLAGLPHSYAKVFQGSLSEDTTISDRALALGRFTGIFSTPFEAGIVYSLSFFAYVFLIFTGRSRSIHALLVLLAIAAAFLAASKAILVSLSLAVASLLFSTVGLRATVQMIPVAALLVAGSLTGMLTLDEWQGRNRVSRWFQFDSQPHAMSLYTGGRFRDDGQGTIQLGLKRAEEGFPFGYGFGDFGVVDNAYFETALMGGIFALTILCYLLLRYLVFGLRNYRYPEGRLITLLFAFAILASIGAPTITKNRFSVIFFVYFCLAVAVLPNVRVLHSASESTSPRQPMNARSSARSRPPLASMPP